MLYFGLFCSSNFVELQQQYSVEISNRSAALDENIYSASIQDEYEKSLKS